MDMQETFTDYALAHAYANILGWMLEPHHAWVETTADSTGYTVGLRRH